MPSVSDVPALKQPFGHVIDGKLISQSAKTLDIINPANEEVVAKVPVGTQETLNQAVDGARKAFKSWSKTTWKERADRIRAWGADFKASMDELIPLLTLEQGKSIAISTSEFNTVLAWFEEMPKMELKEETILKDDSRTVIQRHVPIGVCGLASPSNFPVILTVWKIIPALLTGNVAIVKSSPYTPLCIIRICEAAQKHFPPGVLQCVVGDDSLGPMLTSHPKIDHIAFTGSTATGKAIARTCAADLKRVVLELGGNDPCIVLPDVDVDAVAPGVTMGALLNSGQFCCASKRVYVHEDIYDKFAAAVVKVAQGMKVGNGLEADVLHGPVVSKMQKDKVAEYIEDSQKNGHKFLLGGQVDKNAKGYFIPLSIVDNPPESSRIVQEEPFGPVFPMLKWKNEEELLARVNDSEYGLGAAVWGKDQAAVQRIARGIEAGTVWCNGPQTYDPRVPFAGWKLSGLGVENGIDGLKAYTNIQCLSFGNTPSV